MDHFLQIDNLLNNQKVNVQYMKLVHEDQLLLIVVQLMKLKYEDNLLSKFPKIF
jgi:hypothetical protein